MDRSRVICAIDCNSLDRALELATLVCPYVAACKLGLEFFLKFGPQGVCLFKQENIPVFLDLKLHDIPNTMLRAAEQLRDLEPFMLSVHVASGKESLKAVRQPLAELDTRILGVTLLTSLTRADTHQLFGNAQVEQMVVSMAGIATECHLDGVVCSGEEVAAVKSQYPTGLLAVVPGVRLEAPNDHNRVIGPRAAVSRGADYLVVGRPITESADPSEAAQRFCQYSASEI